MIDQFPQVEVEVHGLSGSWSGGSMHPSGRVPERLRGILQARMEEVARVQGGTVTKRTAKFFAREFAVPGWIYSSDWKVYLGYNSVWYRVDLIDRQPGIVSFQCTAVPTPNIPSPGENRALATGGGSVLQTADGRALLF